MPLTYSLATLGDYVYNVLVSNKTALGLEAIHYGDQERIPVTPTACVETDTKDKRLKGAQRRFEVDLSLYVILYHNQVQSPQENRRDVDTLAEAVETVLDNLITCGGLVIHSAVTRVESGYVRKDTLLRSTRLRFEALSQAVIPQEVTP
jgi:hypothetical protein